ncbi:MAG: tRNA preQ1(34) S-adenosylmethionine ribosyltransferase-isomerase QueA [Betaproteobacteria bacterium RIFCSPLOWO2_12_FULL_65_14]|nr:MAG: tRNA preQ1(34) S-adenosylmethionine ribosyltransferase-isomerase QueA [Betaproteobacteria bacterium RIFCSPLOWO2_12_FULL_65_14]
MLVSEFDYELPAGLIAQHPAAQRSASRLLHLQADGAIADLAFADFPKLVDARDALVLNDTRVIKARLAGRKRSGGRIELFVERILGQREALALIRASHAPAPGAELEVGGGVAVKVEGRAEDLYRVRFSEDIDSVLERFGEVPLPPYITHKPQADDAARYQTVYAAVPGAVAAPTAGLHFDEATLRAIEARGARLASITLHVGAGTFQPVRTDEVEQHRMHKERYRISRQAMDALKGRRVLAVGSTSLRALESAARTGELEGDTDLFITPGFEFKVARRLLTNFHLPRSTLLMLVCAFAGKERIFEAYHHAIHSGYRFFSYGDAMLIET